MLSIEFRSDNSILIVLQFIINTKDHMVHEYTTYNIHIHINPGISMAKGYNNSVILSFCPVRRNSLASIPEVLSICCTLSVSSLVSHVGNRVSNDEAQVLIVLLLLTPSYHCCICDNSQLNCRKMTNLK